MQKRLCKWHEKAHDAHLNFSSQFIYCKPIHCQLQWRIKNNASTLHIYIYIVIIHNQIRFGTVFLILIYFTVLLILSVLSSLLVYLHLFHLDESWYEEAALVTVMKFFPVVLNKFPCSFAPLFAASSYAPDYRHSVLGTNLLLKIPQPESVSLFTLSLEMFNSYRFRLELREWACQIGFLVRMLIQRWERDENSDLLISWGKLFKSLNINTTILKIHKHTIMLKCPSCGVLKHSRLCLKWT